MGYLHIGNLYKEQDILLFKECYALEKVHGTSAHVRWYDRTLHFHSGGVSQEAFEKLFDMTMLLHRFELLGHDDVTVYGEAYGGKMQKMGDTYGRALNFIVFDVKVGDCWLSVPDMAEVAKGLNLESVPFERIPTTLEAIDAARDAPSVVAKRRGCGADKQREGVVLRPLIEVTKNNGERIITKHRLEKFNERATAQAVTDPAKLKVLQEAEAIANEWVTEMRLTHVLDKLQAKEMKDTPRVIVAMKEDVYREAKGEIVESKEAEAAIGKRTAALFKVRVRELQQRAIEEKL